MISYRKLIGFLTLSLLLAGCAEPNVIGKDKSKTSERVIYYVPKNCNNLEYLSAVKDFITSATIIPLNVKPSKGSELDIIGEKKGLICLYGDEKIEAGSRLTITHLSQEEILKRSIRYESSGYKKSIIMLGSGKVASLPVYYKDEVSEVAEMHSSRVEFYIKNLWVTITTSYLYSFEEFEPLISAAWGDILVSYKLSPELRVLLPNNSINNVESLVLNQPTTDDPEILKAFDYGVSQVILLNYKKQGNNYYSNLATYFIFDKLTSNNINIDRNTYGEELIKNENLLITMQGPYRLVFDKEDLNVSNIASILEDINNYTYINFH